MAVLFLEAKSGQCRFPLWNVSESTGLVCGEPVAAPGEPYCAACHARTHTGEMQRVPFIPGIKGKWAPTERQRGDREVDLVETFA